MKLCTFVVPAFAFILTNIAHGETFEYLGLIESNNEAMINPLEPPVPFDLKLTGRGVQRGRNGNESIALACYPDASCTQFRFVLIHDGKAEWIGVPLALTTGNSAVERLEIEKYLTARKKFKPLFTDTGMGHFFTALGIFLGMPKMAALAMTITTSAGPQILITTAPFIILFGVSYLIKGRESHFISDETQKSFTLEYGQAGWNWSEDPIRMRPHRFDQLRDLINGKIIEGRYHLEKANKIDKKIRKLKSAMKDR